MKKSAAVRKDHGSALSVCGGQALCWVGHSILAGVSQEFFCGTFVHLHRL